MPNDPFADFDPTPVAEPSTPPAAPAVPKQIAVTSEPVSEVSVTLKGGSGFDAPWVVVRAGNIPDALSQLKGHAVDLKELLDTASKVGGYFAKTGAQKPASGASRPAPSNQSGQDKPAHQQAPEGQEKFCRHGAMTYRTGSKTQEDGSLRVWKGFFCPTPKGTDGQCKPEFVR